MIRKRAVSSSDACHVLILTPVKDAAGCIEGYCDRARNLTYPHHLISFGFLESDSSDATYTELNRFRPRLERQFRRVTVCKRDFGYKVPLGMHRGVPPIQVERRTVLAKSRNRLLFAALRDEEWVLWLDVDVTEYPPDVLERLLAAGRDIVQPHCVLDYGGPTYDKNAWRDRGRLHLEGRGELETEGLGIMATDMGHRCWGMPHLEIRHGRW
jgi:hypothetical protein